MGKRFEGAIMIALDVDGVLADFYLAACRRYKKPYKRTMWACDWLTREVMEELHGDYHFWRNLPVLSHPESIDFDFQCYMTSIDSRNKKAREDWLTMNGFPEKEVIISNDKITDCEKMGIKYLIDDCPKWRSSESVQVIPFNPSYLVEPFRRSIIHLSEVADFIGEDTSWTKDVRNKL